MIMEEDQPAKLLPSSLYPMMELEDLDDMIYDAFNDESTSNFNNDQAHQASSSNLSCSEIFPSPFQPGGKSGRRLSYQCIESANLPRVSLLSIASFSITRASSIVSTHMTAAMMDFETTMDDEDDDDVPASPACQASARPSLMLLFQQPFWWKKVESESHGGLLDDDGDDDELDPVVEVHMSLPTVKNSSATSSSSSREKSTMILTT